MAAEPEVQQAIQAAGFPTPAFEGFDVSAIRASDRLSDHLVATI